MQKPITQSDVVTFEARGPQDHKVRGSIVEAAANLFDHFGYEKTSVADIAREIGVSSAYVYKFFESKAAIGEAVSANTLEVLDGALWEIARGEGSASARFRNIILTVSNLSKNQYFKAKRLHDLTAQAIKMRWASVERHKTEMKNVVRHVIMDGQSSGEFTRCDSEAAAWAVIDAIYIAAHPLIIEEMQDRDHEARVLRLILFLERALVSPQLPEEDEKSYK